MGPYHLTLVWLVTQEDDNLFIGEGPSKSVPCPSIPTE